MTVPDRDYMIPVGGGVDVDGVMDEMGHAEFTTDETPDGEGVIFEGKIRRLRTPRGRVLLPVEDVIGLIDAQIEVRGSLEAMRRWLVNVTMDDNTPPQERRGVARYGGVSLSYDAVLHLIVSPWTTTLCGIERPGEVWPVVIRGIVTAEWAVAHGESVCADCAHEATLRG